MILSALFSIMGIRDLGCRKPRIMKEFISMGTDPLSTESHRRTPHVIRGYPCVFVVRLRIDGAPFVVREILKTASLLVFLIFFLDKGEIVLYISASMLFS